MIILTTLSPKPRDLSKLGWDMLESSMDAGIH